MIKKPKDMPTPVPTSIHPSQKKYSILSINGGIGKNIAATAVIKAIKREYPDTQIVILTGHPDVFNHNPNVYRTYRSNNPQYFHADFIKDKNANIFFLEPYHTEDYLLKQKHLIDIWCDLCGIKRKGEMPELFLNDAEERHYTLKYANIPFALIQATGGAEGQNYLHSWVRDMPLDIAQGVVDKINQEGALKVYQMRRNNQITLNNVAPIDASMRELFWLVKNATKRVLIDSFAQHASVAFNVKSDVIWVGNNPSVMGYEINNNIVSEAKVISDTTRDYPIEPYDISGDISQYPYKGDIFNYEDVMKQIFN